MRRTTSGLLLFSLGLAAGLMYAPNTGRATRAKLKDKASHYSNEVEDLIFEDTPRLARYYSGRLKGVRHDLMNAMNPMKKRYSGDDPTISNKVRSMIGRPQERIDLSGLNVSTEHGVVYLRGSVRSLREKQRIERIAKQIPEAVNVVNELRVASRRAA